MRTIPSALQTSLEGPAMKLATLIKLKRIDLVTVCMTTWDKPLLVDLDGEGYATYEPTDIESVSQFSAAINAAIDDGELSVPLDQIYVADDIRRQFFSGSIVKVGYVDPDDLTNSWLHRYYETGQVTIEGARVKFELLGPEKRLETPVNIPLTLNCRHQFGDDGCGININVQVWTAGATINEGDERRPTDAGALRWWYAAQAGTGGVGTTGATEPNWALATSGDIVDNDIVWHEFDARRVFGVVTNVTDNRNFAASGIAIREDYFAEGYIAWAYGLNAGEKQRIRYDGGNGSIIQHRPCLDTPQIGDTFFAIVGCRKRLAEDCVHKHDNKNRSSSKTLRFGGFPFLAPEQATAVAPKDNPKRRRESGGGGG